MSKFFALHEVGIELPDIDILNGIANRLGGDNRPTIFYGGAVRDLVIRGNLEGTGDIDVAMSITDFLALKPPPGYVDVRRQMVLHEPHLLFMLHQIDEKTFAANPRPVVLSLKKEVMAEWGLSIPVGLTLTRHPVKPFEFGTDTDLGFTQIVTDGYQIYVTQAFVNDMRNRTLTLLRCRDKRDYERSMRRIERFTAPGGRYQGWTPVIPDEFQQFAPIAA